MTAHIVVPAFDVDPSGAPDPTTVDGQGLPATLNPHVLTTLLREQLGYDGLVITDGLEMQGVVERFGSGEAAVRAVVAGADMVMVLWSVEKKREVRDAHAARPHPW